MARRWGWIVGGFVACSGPAEPTSTPRPARPAPRIEAAVTAPEAAALREILAVVPSADPSARARADLVGTPTLEPEGPTDAPLDAPGAARPPRASLRVGPIDPQPGSGSAAVERAARAQLYWPLVSRCRLDGRPLPPSSVQISFNLDAEGTMVPSTLRVDPLPGFEGVRECIVRELSAISFRVPPSVRGGVVAVRTTIPSVD